MPAAVLIPILIDLASAAVWLAETYGLQLALTAASVVIGREQQRRAANRARDAYNANLTDHQVMIRSAIAPRTIVYGRDKVSGPVPFGLSTGAKGEYLLVVVVLAAHECDAIEKVYFNEIEVPVDSDGFVRTGQFAKTQAKTTVQSVTGTSLTLTHAPTRITGVTKSVDTGDGVDRAAIVPSSAYSLSGSTITFTSSGSYFVNYEYDDSTGTPLVRIRKHLGGPGQVADPDLVAESGGKWTSAHVGVGICYLYVRLQYDQEVFGQIGVPQISGVVRGKKVRDPRTGATAWSENWALCTGDYMLDADLGMGFAVGELPDDELTVAANISDEDVALDHDGTTQKRYTLNGSLSVDTGRRAALESLLAPGAGTAVWVQGRWLLRAGAWRTPEWTLDESWLADGPLQTSPRPARTDLFNALTGTYVDPNQGYAEVAMPAVTNAMYETEDGGKRISKDVQMPYVRDSLRGQRLNKITLERARQALTLKATCNMRAYNTLPTQVGTVNLARYGFVSKAFEVTEREFDVGANKVALTLRETASAVWDWNYGEATTTDLAPNTVLPDPFAVPPQLANLAVATGSDQLQVLADGTIITRGLVSWDASADIYVQSGGSIELQWKLDSATTWQSASPVSGDSTSAYIGPLDDRRVTLVRVRAVSGLGKPGPWATVAITVIGKTELPDNVTGFSFTLIPGGVQFNWSPETEADYLNTELHDEAVWNNATAPKFKGNATTWTWMNPSLGSHTILAKNRDTSGNLSSTAASVTFTIDQSMLQQTLTPSANISVIGNTVKKVSGTNAWDSGAYSQERYAGGCYVSFQAGQTNAYLMCGLNQDAEATSGYADIDYTWYPQNDGSLRIYESGAAVGGGTNFGSYDTDDVLSIVYDNESVTYMLNGVVKRTIAVAAGRIFGADMSLYSVGGQLKNVRFGPAGSHGADGTASKILVLAASSQVFQIPKNGGAIAPASITFTANGQGLAGTPSFSVTAGTATLTGSGLTRSLTPASMTTDTVTITCTWDGETDQITVVKVREGSDAYNGLLTNESATVAADAVGTVASFAGAGGEYRVWLGATELTTGVVYSLVNSSGVTLSINASTGVYAITAMSADNGTATLRATIGSTVIDKLYTIAKSRAGVNGLDGSDAKIIVVASSSQLFQVAKSGTVSPSSIAITVAGQHVAGSPVFAVTSGTATLTGSGNSRTLAYANMTSDNVTVTVTWDGQTDSVSIAKVREGSDAYNGLLTNEAATVSATAGGTVSSFAAAGGEFRVWLGASELTTGVVYSVVSSSGVTIAINSSSGVYTVSAMSADSGTATLRATIGSTVIDKLYTIAKSKAGTDGADGQTLTLQATSLTFKVPASGSATPSSITLTAVGQNLAGSPTFSVTGGATLTGSGNTRSLAYANMTVDSVTVTVAWGTLSASQTIVKVRDGSNGSSGTQTVVFPYVIAEQFVLQPNTARAEIRFNSDGTISRVIGTTATNVGNWYLPTTTGIGSSHYLRVQLLSGDSPGALGSWRQILTNQSAVLSTNNSDKQCALAFQVASDSSGNTITGQGNGELHVASET
jgi:hypothetical protein